MIKDGLEIKVFGGNLQQALRVFTRRTQQSGLMGEVRRRSEFVDANKKRRLKSWRAQSKQNRHKRRAEVRAK